MADLFWHCTGCGAHEPVVPTGEGVEYIVGDKEPCISCGKGTAHVMTLKMAACFEQGMALGKGTSLALARARFEHETAAANHYTRKEGENG